MSTSPYPGICPVNHRGQLKGRDHTVALMVDYLENNYPRLIELHGPSGVGKSSFLRAGLAPRLEERGWRVLLISDWDGIVVESPDAGDSYVSVLRREMERSNASRDALDRSGLLGSEDMSEASQPERTMIIFDQFEELLRVDPDLARSLLARACELVSEVGGCWHIVSFRSEVRHEIADLVERNLTTSNWIAAPVEPVEGLEVVELVRAPLEVEGRLLGRASDDFVDAIASAWEAVSAGETSPPHSVRYIEPGLLHLQALLAVCWDRASLSVADGVVQLDVDLLPTEVADDPVALFSWGLEEYLRTRITAAAHAADQDSRAQRALVLTAARIVPHLWSAGFKTPQETRHLTLLSLPRLRRLRLSSTLLDKVLLATEQGPGHMSGAALSECLPDSLRERGDSAAVAGMAAATGLSPVEVACELVATFENALDILKSEAIVRVTQGRDRRIVSLSHDALGEQLADWKDHQLNTPWESIDSLVAISGEQVLGDVLAEPEADTEIEWRPEISGPEFGVLDHLVWAGCEITASFRNVVFRDCWFNGSVFRRCRFEDIRFENCVFWGAAFMDCEFTGSGEVIVDGGAELRTLSFLWRDNYQGPMLDFDPGGSLCFNGLHGRGLFVENGGGGPVQISGCKLDHVNLAGREDEARVTSVSISDSTVAHLQLGSHVERPVKLTGATVVTFADASDGSLGNAFECDSHASLHEGPS